MLDALFVDEQVIFAATAQMLSVIAVMNLATLHRTAPTRFFLQEHHTSKTDLIQGIDIPTPEGIDQTPPIMVPGMGDISAGHSHTAIPTMTEVAVPESTPWTPHPATTAACAALWLMDASIPTHVVTPTGIVTSIPHSPLLPQMSLTPLHRLEPVLLQQLLPHCTGNAAKKSQAMSKTFNLP